MNVVSLEDGFFFDCTLIHVYKNPVKMFFENRFRSGQVDYFGVQKEVGWFMVFNATFKQKNAFGWTDISVHVSFICFYFYLNAMLPHSDHQDIFIQKPCKSVFGK
jgi:hypothetical protein